MILLHAPFQIDADRREEALAQIDPLVKASNKENGLIEYRTTVDLQDRNEIRFFERYENADAIAAHNQTDHFQAFAKRLPELLAGEPEVWKFEGSKASQLEV